MRKSLVWASLGLNVVVFIVGGAWVAEKGGPRYVAEQFGLVRPVAPQRKFQVDAAEEFRQWPNGAGEIVFAGDSITGDMPWEEALTVVRNRGIGGETSDGLLRRFDEIIASGPAQVFINIGTNDLSRGYSAGDVLANVRAMLDRSGSGTQVLLISVLPINLKFKDDSVHRLKQAALPSLNDGLRAMSAEKGAVFIDLWPYFAGEDGQLNEELTSDGTHLNAAGKILYAQKIKPYVMMDQSVDQH